MIGDGFPGPPEAGHYKSPHGIKPGVTDSFEAVLQLIVDLML